jgi:hypothetical protein
MLVKNGKEFDDELILRHENVKRRTTAITHVAAKKL